MQIATWNINSLKVRLAQVIDWLTTTNCDVLALQELKLDNSAFPVEEFKNIGYHAAYNGQKTYNGVAILSKIPMQNIVCDIMNYLDPQKRVIAATIDGIRVICVYVVNGEAVDSVKYTYKLEWLSKLHDYVVAELAKHKELIILGDFNIAPLDIDVYDPVAWQGQVLCSEPERQAWRNLLSIGLSDGFRLFNSESRQYSWWDYRNMAFRRKMGLRIDHILLSNELKNRAIDCVIDTNPRRNERPSDHTPVVLTLK